MSPRDDFWVTSRRHSDPITQYLPLWVSGCLDFQGEAYNLLESSISLFKDNGYSTTESSPHGNESKWTAALGFWG